jgi:Zn ribbon nucleic-acid-binding protein
MAALEVHVECAQCGRKAPTDPRELAAWRHADLFSEDEPDDVTAALVLCPDCDAEDRRGEFEPGEAG